MKKIIISLMTLSVFACTNNTPTKSVQDINSLSSSMSKSGVNQIQSNSEVKLSFNIKAVTPAEQRVKSVDVYLVNVAGLTDPTNANNQVVAMKSVDVVNGVVSTTFTLPVPVVFTGPYYAVVQAFDNTIPPAVPRNNITAANPLALNLPLAYSSNTANYSNGQVVYSSGNALTMVMNLAPYNKSNADVTLQNGSSTPTNPITVTEQPVP